ncbi:MAG: hypothetical protein RLZZ385_513 [Pseudomonadota bacterium]|jgi:uncharacterized OsmC-like protein
MEQKTFQVDLKLLENYLFQIDFGEFGNFMTDEPEPLGGGEGPAPSALLAASVANCLSASLLFAIRKFKSDPGELSARCEGTLERIEGRWRIVKLAVGIQMEAAAQDLTNLERVLAIFEDYCVVTQSVRHGIPVEVEIRDGTGAVLKQPAA